MKPEQKKMIMYVIAEILLGVLLIVVFMKFF